jgi:membrane protein
LVRCGEDNVPRLAAALAFYTTFSLAPILVIVSAIGGFAFGPTAVRQEIVYEARSLVGDGGGSVIEAVFENRYLPESGMVATVAGLITLFVGATAVFTELQHSLNAIWRVQPKAGVRRFLLRRLIAFAMVLGLGFLLLVSLIISASLSALGHYMGSIFPEFIALLQLLTFFLTLIVSGLVIAVIFKFVPDVQLDWADVWLGASVTTTLFTAGKIAIGLYLGNSQIVRVYGAAGSLVVLLFWVYFAAQILLFGAELTRTYTQRYGSHVVRPLPGAVPSTE